jgi:hypothetical protein
MRARKSLSVKNTIHSFVGVVELGLYQHRKIINSHGIILGPANIKAKVL